MTLDTLTVIYFSPTGTTRRVLKGIADGINIPTSRFVDLTPPAFPKEEIPPIEAGYALIGVPVYAGRVPLPAVDRLKKLTARNVPAALVVMYGNRAFDDSLLELREISMAAGFIPVAGAAFIGEHSFAREDTPIALGRPDENDLIMAKEFGRRVREKFDAAASSGGFPVRVPGNVPYRERMPSLGLVPETREDVCTLCGTCRSVCPAGAVAADGKIVTDAGLCIMCHACVKRCPTGARAMESGPVRGIAKWLLENHAARRDPEWFL